MSAELKPCPFCDDVGAEVAESYLASAITGKNKLAVYCNTCFCEGPTHDTEDGAIAAWNRRALAAPSQPAEPVAQAVIGKSLLRKVDEPLPKGCYCKPGKCAAPVIMGRQTPCRDPAKAAGQPSPAAEQAAQAEMICSKCGTDRFKAPCPTNRWDCGLMGVAQAAQQPFDVAKCRTTCDICGEWPCARDVRRLKNKVKPKPVADDVPSHPAAEQAAADLPAPTAWLLGEQVERRETTYRGRIWFVDPVSAAWVPIFTAEQMHEYRAGLCSAQAAAEGERQKPCETWCGLECMNKGECKHDVPEVVCPACGSEEWDRITNRVAPGEAFNRCNSCENEWVEEGGQQ